MKKIKKSAFPNNEFRSQQEYFEFADEHKVYGSGAYDLKKKMDKETRIPMPKLKLEGIGGE